MEEESTKVRMCGCFLAQEMVSFLNLLQSITASPIADCQKALMADVIPSQYFCRGFPGLYEELYPALIDYLSSYDWGNHTVTAYFQEYRRLKLLDTLTDAFAA